MENFRGTKKSLIIVTAIIIIAILLLPPLLGNDSDDPTNNPFNLGGNEFEVRSLINESIDMKQSILTEISPFNPEDLFVASKTGHLWLIEDYLSTPSLKLIANISERVLTSNENGLIGIEFDPNATSNNYIYLTYSQVTERGSSYCRPCSDTMISRFNLTEDFTLDLESELEILRIPQQSNYHKSGKLLFGPDEMLYIGVGDSSTHGQDLTTLYGSLLRLNVSATSPGRNYTIPTDNPFYNNSNEYREEIWAYGLRNPWTFSFDPEGNLWVADVGSVHYEEINIIQKGKNYGWNVTEGYECIEGLNITDTCDRSAFEDPIYAYSHNETRDEDDPYGYGIIGGGVYSSDLHPELKGDYIFADINGKVWKAEYSELNGAIQIDDVSYLFQVQGGVSQVIFDVQGNLIFTLYTDKIFIVS